MLARQRHVLQTSIRQRAQGASFEALHERARAGPPIGFSSVATKSRCESREGIGSSLGDDTSKYERMGVPRILRNMNSTS